MKLNVSLLIAILALNLLWFLYFLIEFSLPEFYVPFVCSFLFGIGIAGPMLTKKCKPMFTTILWAISLLIWIGISIYSFL